MVAPTCFDITLPSSGRVPSAFWEMLSRGAVDRKLWMGVLCLVTWCVAISVLWMGVLCLVTWCMAISDGWVPNLSVDSLAYNSGNHHIVWMTVVGLQPHRAVPHYSNRSTFIHARARVCMCVCVCVCVCKKVLNIDRLSSDQSALYSNSDQNVLLFFSFNHSRQYGQNTTHHQGIQKRQTMYI
jgi:hypothetical protein